MARVTWSNRAVAELWEIRDFIAEEAPSRADAFVDKLIERTTVLRTQRYVGRVVPGADTETLREVFEGAYRIVYSIESSGDVIIAHIVNMARLLKS